MSDILDELDEAWVAAGKPTGVLPRRKLFAEAAAEIRKLRDERAAIAAWNTRSPLHPLTEEEEVDRINREVGVVARLDLQPLVRAALSAFIAARGK